MVVVVVAANVVVVVIVVARRQVVALGHAQAWGRDRCVMSLYLISCIWSSLFCCSSLRISLCSSSTLCGPAGSTCLYSLRAWLMAAAEACALVSSSATSSTHFTSLVSVSGDEGSGILSSRSALQSNTASQATNQTNKHIEQKTKQQQQAYASAQGS